MYKQLKKEIVTNQDIQKKAQKAIVEREIYQICISKYPRSNSKIARDLVMEIIIIRTTEVIIKKLL